MSDEPMLWRYSLKNVNHEGWAVFLLDSWGMLAVCSDFGNYAFHWPRGGWGDDDFRRFLAGIDSYYLVRKLNSGHPSVLYGDETRKNIKRQILQWRKDGELPASEARDEYDMACSNDFDSDADAREWVVGSALPDAHELIQRGPPRDLVAFSERVWPRFVKLLKEDLEAK